VPHCTPVAQCDEVPEKALLDGIESGIVAMYYRPSIVIEFE
jgi:hypothetical protein